MKRSLLLFIAVIVLVKLAAVTPVYLIDCSAKPAGFFDWSGDNNKMSFPVDMPGIMKIVNDYSPFAPSGEISSSNLTANPYINIKIKTTANELNGDGSVRPSGIQLKIWNSNIWDDASARTIWMPVLKTDEFQVVRFDIPTDFTPNDIKRYEIRFCQNNSGSWAAGGTWYLDYIAFGGEVADPIPPVVVTTAPVYLIDCTAKPAGFFDWSGDNNKMSFPVDMPGIMKIVNDYNAFAPSGEISSSNLTAVPYIFVKIKTTANELNNDGSVRPSGIQFKVWNSDIWGSNNKTIWMPVLKTDEFQVIRFDIPTTDFTPNDIKRYEMRFCQNNAGNWPAGGTWYIDYIAFGGVVADLTTAVNKQKITENVTFVVDNNNVLHVSGINNTNFDVQVYNLSGNLLKSMKYEQGMKINALGSGAYIVAAKKNGVLYSQKVILK